MFKLFDKPYLSKAYQPTPSEREEAVAENEWVELQKQKRRGQGYLRMHQRIKGAVRHLVKTYLTEGILLLAIMLWFTI